MTEHEVLELIGMHVSQVDKAFEFWLTISFGVLVALHIARSSITRQLKLLLCFLYVSATLIAVFHTVGDLLQAYQYMEMIRQDSPANAWNGMGALLRAIVYTVGTASVSVAIFRYDVWVSDSDT
jgi:hypothetical protein